jgi:hypothetical protein
VSECERGRERGQGEGEKERGSHVFTFVKEK